MATNSDGHLYASSLDSNIHCYNFDPMELKELTQYMHDFVRAKGWYEPDSPHPQTLRNLAISLNLEASEVLEQFQWGEKQDDMEGLSTELADVALYLLQIASLSGIDLEQAIMRKLESNYNRIWYGRSSVNEPRDESRVQMSKVDGKPVSVTVFGGSKTSPGEPVYEAGLALGKLLGEAGYTVFTGGYIGTMEAVSKGASLAGAHVIGVTCDEIEAWRPVAPNPWIMEERRFPTLRKRLYALIESCDAALALPGGIGTLAEIAVMWSQLQTGASDPKPLILIGGGWESTIHTFWRVFGDYIPENDRKWVHIEPDNDSAFYRLQSLIALS